MIKTYRGDVVWWVDASLLEDPCINRTDREPDTDEASGFRLARTQQVLENTEGKEWRDS